MSAFLGLDVAKSKVDAALFLENGKFKTKAFANKPEGFAELQEWLVTLEAAEAPACMEATGIYHEALATFLFDNGHTVSVVNPQRIKSFGASEGIRTKNDQGDARLIARFGKVMRPQAWLPAPLEIRELRDLGRRRDELVVMRDQERNRAGGSVESVEESIASLLASTFPLRWKVEQEITAIERKSKEHIASHPGLKNQIELLESIPGIGRVCASAILSETHGFSRFERVAEAVAFAGLSPQERSSGTSVHGKASISKKGNSRPRRLLYMPALNAKGYNPLVARLTERLEAKGKPGKMIICACMKKLLQIAFGVLKRNTPFNPNLTPLSP